MNLHLVESMRDALTSEPTELLITDFYETRNL